MVLGLADPLDRLVVVRHEDETGLQMRRIGQGGLQVEGDDRAVLEGLARRAGPVFLQRIDRLAFIIAGKIRGRRQGQGDRPLVGIEGGRGIEEVEAAGGRVHHICAVDIAQHAAPGRNVLWIAAEDLDGLIEDLAALQRLGDIGIAGRCQFAGLPFARHVKGILVDPGHGLLAFGQDEAAFHKGPRRHVEFADNRGVGAAVGQGDEAVGLVGRQAVAALEDPVLALGLRQRVDVEDRCPHRLAGAIAGPGGAAPHPLRMLGILPEIVDHAVAGEGRHGDAVVVLQDLQRGRLVLGKAGIGGQARQGLVVMRLDPIHGLVAIDLIEIGPRIGRAGGGGIGIAVDGVGHGGRGLRQGRGTHGAQRRRHHQHSQGALRHLILFHRETSKVGGRNAGLSRRRHITEV